MTQNPWKIKPKSMQAIRKPNSKSSQTHLETQLKNSPNPLGNPTQNQFKPTEKPSQTKIKTKPNRKPTWKTQRSCCCHQSATANLLPPICCRFAAKSTVMCECLREEDSWGRIERDNFGIDIWEIQFRWKRERFINEIEILINTNKKE